MAIDTSRLPRPDKFEPSAGCQGIHAGNYWLGNKFSPADAAVLASRCVGPDMRVVDTGTWLAFLGAAGGFLFEGGVLKRFKTPEEALEAIRHHCRKGAKK